ncbi:MAG: hypothetical protein M1831_004376 [Alyxoria varia]|nr:MAG: hypothetical protein M1831_004376 [Alyxoria varia]
MTDESNKRFDHDAKHWDGNDLVQRLTKEAFQALLKAFPDLKRQKDEGSQQMKVLELGCGTGLLSFQIAPYVHSLVASDPSTGMIDALRAKIKSEDSPRNVYPLCFTLEDSEDSALPPAVEGDGSDGPRQKFDLTLSHMVLHHIPQLKDFLRSALGCLKPGIGEAFFTDFQDFGPEAKNFHPHSKMEGVARHGIKVDETVAMMEEVGYADVSIETGWRMFKDVERHEGEWDSMGPKDEHEGKPVGEGVELASMEFPFLVIRGRRP